jgi:hypothetical protein
MPPHRDGAASDHADPEFPVLVHLVPPYVLNLNGYLYFIYARALAAHHLYCFFICLLRLFTPITKGSRIGCPSAKKIPSLCRGKPDAMYLARRRGK